MRSISTSANVALVAISLLPVIHCWASTHGSDVMKRGTPIYGRNGYNANTGRFKNGGYGGGPSMKKGSSTSGRDSGSGRDSYNALITDSSNNDAKNYNFAYEVQDPETYNYHSRQETGRAHPKSQVTGSYSLMEPDGSTRTVDYVADWATGFKAIVRDKNGVTQHGYGSDGGGSNGESFRAYDGGAPGGGGMN